jgi:hypothetical protein
MKAQKWVARLKNFLLMFELLPYLAATIKKTNPELPG